MEFESEEDVVEILKRRKVTQKLKIGKTRTRVKNKRIPKHVAPVSTEGVSLNSQDEEAKWKFGADVVPTVDNSGPYWPKLVREFICNLTKEICDPESDNYQKVTLRNLTFVFNPEIINDNFGRQNEGVTGERLELSAIVCCSSQGGSCGSDSTTHMTRVNETMEKTLYVLGSNKALNFGRVIFNHIMEHAKLKPIERQL
ncbi:hypothetical protein LIER_43183 [Lithospermum erythrorhizon]|uniref:Uncharacterized protein n=1 Tax=Lithospermum erythrorhizon TaxID=34254 RepID=A0AAV3PN46_LITER